MRVCCTKDAIISGFGALCAHWLNWKIGRCKTGTKVHKRFATLFGKVYQKFQQCAWFEICEIKGVLTTTRWSRRKRKWIYARKWHSKDIYIINKTQAMRHKYINQSGAKDYGFKHHFMRRNEHTHTCDLRQTTCACMNLYTFMIVAASKADNNF